MLHILTADSQFCYQGRYKRFVNPKLNNEPTGFLVSLSSSRFGWKPGKPSLSPLALVMEFGTASTMQSLSMLPFNCPVEVQKSFDFSALFVTATLSSFCSICFQRMKPTEANTIDHTLLRKSSQSTSNKWPCE